MRYIEKNSHVGKKKVFENQRLVARKTYGLSRRQQRFKSAWGRQQETEGASLYPENQVFVVRLLYYPALVKPSLPALKPLRSLQPRHVLRPSGKNSPYVQKLRALPVQGVTSVMKMTPSSGKRMACAPHCFSLPTGCTRLLWPRLKAGPSGPSARFGCAT